MDGFRLWWNSTVDYDWLLAYHRSHPLLKHAETLTSVYGILHAMLCIGLLLTPGVVAGTSNRVIVMACVGVALALSAFAISRRIETKRASVAFIAGSDTGIAAVLLCLTPSPFTILATALFSGIGNYAATFHGARVTVAHYGLMLAVLVALLLTAIADGTWPIAALLTTAGTAFVVLFTSSVILQALVSQLRQDAAGAYFDPLTGLRNRRGLVAALKELCRDRSRDAPLLWTIAVDLDGFKAVNDRFGHDYGDHVLRRTAVRIEQACRPPTIAARVGGEEFTVVGTGTEIDAGDCADRIMAFVYDDRDDIPVTASLGVSTLPRDQLPTDVEAAVSLLAARADAAMYQAKNQGGHRVVHADPILG